MTAQNFEQGRRQRFLDRRYFEWLSKFLQETTEHWKHSIPANGSEAERKATAAWLRALGQYQLMMLRYTAGGAIEPMRGELEDVITSFEAYSTLNRVAEESATYPPFVFSEVYLYELAMQLIGLCYLLHRVDLLPRLAAMLDPAYLGKDTLYEDLLAYELEGRYDVDQWFHDRPYRDLINSLYRDTDEESIADLKQYLEIWYSAMEKTPWHGAHLKQADESGTYYGYWAIEAAAVTYLLGLDDSSYRDHVVYPKDLVDFARKLDAGADGSNSDRLSLRCEAGETCPKAGYWLTPAKAGSRRYFAHGEVMPTVASDYGSTIWQWDNDQSDPKL
ncbi:hypothetical protein LMG7141_03133 [Ralstonia condita]|uniref:PoNi C-terminal domain-containing protein n=1 Tax=Ralstonia condita TaxID=3058600 RepID=A0ABM9JK96_9RALS|nr:PoNe immunity protein domain-containing protein [Ralstonia sp. LMG 7141]CAJ0795709.1 hypothetical protein LMG7141_03133 [Ralstonia sp. LMG 7141]